MANLFPLNPAYEFSLTVEMLAAECFSKLLYEYSQK